MHCWVVPYSSVSSAVVDSLCVVVPALIPCMSGLFLMCADSDSSVIMYRYDDSGSPCLTPDLIGMLLVCLSFIITLAVLLWYKFSISVVNVVGNPFAFRQPIMKSWLTLSNAFSWSMESMKPSSFFASRRSSSICALNALSVMSWLGMKPFWLSCIMVLIILLSLFAMILVKIL